MRVALFVTCVADLAFPRLGESVVEILERLGHAVDFPRAQTCCGQMHYNSGYLREALPLAQAFVTAFEPYDAVVIPSASCTGMVRHGYPNLARRDRNADLLDRVQDVASRVWELSEFLVDVLAVENVGATFPHRVTYHPTCHALRLLRTADRPLRLLRNVTGLELADLPSAEECCGFGGTFALKNSDISASMCADKVRRVRETGAEVICAADYSCLANIGGMLDRQRAGVRWMHFAEILASTSACPR